MSLFEFLVPVIALAVSGVGIIALRRQARTLDHARKPQHPAE